jgi:uncharacterized protein YukE
MADILYNHAPINELGTGVINYAAVLQELNDDMKRKANWLGEFYQGSAPEAFHNAFMQMSAASDDVVDTARRFGQTILTADAMANHVDEAAAGGF